MSENKETPVTSSLLKEDELFYTIFEPKVPNRFICYTKYDDGKVVFPTFVTKCLTRPYVIRNNDKWQWQPLTMELYDPIVPSTSQALYNYIDDPRPFDMTVNLLGPVGDKVEEWKIVNPQITEINFGDLDWSWPPNDGEEKKRSKLEHINLIRYYKGSGPLLILIKIKYDFAELIY